MTPVETIYQKYISVFYELDAGGAWIDLAAVRYALRAALREMAAAQPAVDITQKHRDLAATVLEIESVLATHAGDAYADFVDRHIELPTVIARVIEGHKAALSAKLTPDRCQLERINEWLFEHAPDLADNPLNNTADASIAAMDRLRGQVVLLQKLADWLDTRYVNDSDGNEVDTAIKLLEFQAAEVDALRQQLAQMDADNARLTQELRTVRSWSVAPTGSGKSQTAAVEAARAADQPEQYPPAIVAALVAASDPVLFMPVEQAAEVIAQEAAAEAAQQAALDVGDDAELHGYIVGLDAKRHTWRTIPKSVRWRLVKARLNSIWTDGKLPSMVDFDADRPAWMPTASACAMTFGDGKWSVVCGKAAQP